MEQRAPVTTGVTRHTRTETAASSAEKHQGALEIVFPLGLIGCPTWRRFSLAPDPFASLGELISQDEPGVSLFVADPAWLRADFSFELDEEDATVLDLDDVEDARVLTILSVHREPAAIFANLAGPLVINWKKRIGHQVILDHHAYPLRAPVLAGEAARAIVDAMLVESIGDAAPSHYAAPLTARKGA